MAEHNSLFAALAAAHAEYPAVVKRSDNPHFKSKYADLADGMDLIRPVLAKHGLSYTQTFHVADGILMLRTSLHFGSESVDSELPIQQPPRPQDFVSLTTYYRRVGLFCLCGITPAGDDDDGNAVNDVVDTQAPARRQQPPARKLDVVGKPPAEAVEIAMAAADPDPWKLREVPVEDLVPLLSTAIALRPWPDVQRLLPMYVADLKMSELGRQRLRTAFAARKEQVRADNLIAAG